MCRNYAPNDERSLNNGMRLAICVCGIVVTVCVQSYAPVFLVHCIYTCICWLECLYLQFGQFVSCMKFALVHVKFARVQTESIYLATSAYLLSPRQKRNGLSVLLRISRLEGLSWFKYDSLLHIAKYPSKLQINGHRAKCFNKLFYGSQPWNTYYTHAYILTLTLNP